MKSLVAAALTFAMMIGAPIAHADGTDDLICQESRMGMSPGQISDSIHSGDPFTRNTNSAVR